jgi:hypothetical protein
MPQWGPRRLSPWHRHRLRRGVAARALARPHRAARPRGRPARDAPAREIQTAMPGTVIAPYISPPARYRNQLVVWLLVMKPRLSDAQFSHRKNKVAQRAELVERGLWQVFVDRRESLKSSGVPAPQAWAQAFEEVTSGGVSVGGDGVGGDDVGVGVVVADGVGYGGVEKSGAPDSLGRVKLEVLEGRACSITRTVEWVAKMMMVEDPRAEDAPSMEAWSMLSWARRSNQNEAQFWGQIWSKMMPSKQQLEAAERLSDDGSQVFAVIERIRLASESSRSDGKELEGDAGDGR